MNRKVQSLKGEMAEVVLQSVGIMGDTRCPRCGTRFEVDFYCEKGHSKPVRKRKATIQAFLKEHSSPEAFEI